ncbi:TIGR02206 family membrane protein [Oscillospiraceae bacterium WX1]
MVTNFKSFGAIHITSLLFPIVLIAIFIFLGLKAKTDRKRRLLRYILAVLIIVIRGTRYVMDVYYGVFEWTDLLSLHICHIDLVVLVICLVRPNKALFNFCFLVGIPFALSVALFPGRNHPAPGIPRAVLFIMSHMMLVAGALYLAIVERLKPSLGGLIRLAVLGNVCLIPVYLVNRIFGTNYLYLMEAPKGTVIVPLAHVFGWPGYVAVLDAVALLCMLFMLAMGLLFHRAIGRTLLKSPNR